MANPADELHTDPLLFTAPTLEGFKVLDPAVLYARVGQGGMGAVYRGRHVSLECDVAVKVLKSDLATDEQFVLRFEREAKLAARIKNENVVQVLDVRQKNGIHYLVMEFVKGETARERVKRKGRLKEAEALAILFGAARGLRAAHADGVVHRDIKPENVLIAADGAVKLADLGLAKSQPATGEQSMTMLSSGVMGTPQYMPPEQWLSPNVTPAADIWALGATLHYLLSGRSAIEPGELLAIAGRIRDQDFPALPSSVEVRPEVRAILQKCTRREPKERFADARELTRALAPLLSRDDDDNVLVDADSGTGPKTDALVTPPPRATLAKIRLQIAGDEGDVTVARPSGTPAPAAAAAGEGSGAVSGPRGTVVGGMPAPAPLRPRHRALAAVLWVVVLGGLGVAIGYGKEHGWFGPGPVVKPEGPQPPTQQPPQPQPQPPTQPQPQAEPLRGDPYGAGTQIVTDAAAARSAKALDLGKALLPQSGKLAEALAALEDAVGYDPRNQEGRALLGEAHLQRAKQRQVEDVLGALDDVDLAARLAPENPGVAAARALLATALQQQLLRELKWSSPAADAVLDAGKVPVLGQLETPAGRGVRFAVVPVAAAAEPFPSATSAAPLILGGAFTGHQEVADGSYVVRLVVEAHGVAVEAPPRAITVDTAPPKLTITEPQELDLVGAQVAVRGRVEDATQCTVTVGKLEAAVGKDGTWGAVVVLPDQVQKVAVVARDAVGHETARSIDLRVDARPPALTITAGLPERTDQARCVIAGKIVDDSKVSLTIGGTVVAVGDDGAFSVPVTFDKAGPQQLEVVATDRFGQVTRQTLRGSFEPPAVVKTDEPPKVPRGTKPATLSPETPKAPENKPAESKPAEQPAPPVVPARLPLEAWATRADNAKDVEFRGATVPSVVVEKKTGMRFHLILPPPADYLMGSPEKETGRSADEKQHAVVMTEPFWLGETEVRQDEWSLFLPNNSTFKAGNLPVENVSWDECQQFVQKLGPGFRLPTEAEWEYACRAGTKTAFAFGATVTSREVNCDGSEPYGRAKKSEFRNTTLPVRDLAPNDFGLFQMHGNVAEWCQDVYSFDSAIPANKDTGTRVVRGGGFDRVPLLCRSACRQSYPRGAHFAFLGLRIARSW